MMSSIIFLLIFCSTNGLKHDYEWRMGYGKSAKKIVRLKTQTPDDLLRRNYKTCFIINIFVPLLNFGYRIFPFKKNFRPFLERLLQNSLENFRKKRNYINSFIINQVLWHVFMESYG